MINEPLLTVLNIMDPAVKPVFVDDWCDFKVAQYDFVKVQQ